MKFWFVTLSALIVLFALLVCLVAAGTMRSGHPPASGIVVLVVFMLIGPLSSIAALIGLFTKPRPDMPRFKWFFIATGIHVLCALFCLMVWFFKSVLGWTL
ncbi:MAG: hypothetical protein H6510_17950 [Acidobacteria bacterium]|nr:hypothetical protein [Acidobacteriota bacterium]MCB9399701.1 hypothetical protein [Acidobacteriota bacterium]